MAYSKKVRAAAKIATRTTIWVVSELTSGNISAGVATSNTIKNARAIAPGSRLNTALYLNLVGRDSMPRPLFQLDPADCGGLPHICHILAHIPIRAASNPFIKLRNFRRLLGGTGAIVHHFSSKNRAARAHVVSGAALDMLLVACPKAVRPTMSDQTQGRSCAALFSNVSIDGLLLQRQADIVEAVEQAMLAERRRPRRQISPPSGPVMTLVFEVDRHLRRWRPSRHRPSACRPAPAAARSAGCRS